MTHVNISAIARNAHPVVQIENGQAITTSVEVARVFGKQHRHVLDSIRTLIAQLSDEGVPNFRQTPYTDPQNGQTYPAYHLTKDGVALLTFGFTGKRAMAFKLAYIKAFNEMEAALLDRARPDHFVDASKKVWAPDHSEDIRAMVAPGQQEIPMTDSLSDTGISPEMISDIVASTTQNIVATLQQKRKLIHWPEVIEALQNPKTDMQFSDLTALAHAVLSRLQSTIDGQAYTAITRRAAKQGVSTLQVPLNA